MHNLDWWKRIAPSGIALRLWNEVLLELAWSMRPVKTAGQ